MKKAVSSVEYILFALIILPPLVTLIFSGFGYKLSFFGYTFIALLTAAAAVTQTILCVFAKYEYYGKIVSVLIALSAPLVLIGLMLYLSVDGNVSAIACACMFICFVCCGFLTLRRAKPFALKIIAVVISALLIHPFAAFTFFNTAFGDFGKNTVVQTVPSPSGEFYAQVIDSNQGALGGDTIVNVVYKATELNAGVFKIEKSPKRVYSGEWGEYENMEIYWKDDNVLVINAAEYTIN